MLATFEAKGLALAGHIGPILPLLLYPAMPKMVL